MPNKRSKRKQTQEFYCPYCSSRLWRNGLKHNIYYESSDELRQDFKISRKNALLLFNQNKTYLKNNCWLENFFCEKHDQIWLLVSKDSDGNLVTRLADKQDWHHTTKTINPDLPNPSVSEFSYRQSRRAGIHNLRDKSYNI
jgi:hypothetical protein